MIGSIAAVCATIVWLWVAWRGKRVDDHPLCRSCGYDLVGQGLLTSESRCPECGRSVALRSAIRIGHRRSNPRLASLAAIALMASLFFFGLHAWSRIAKVPISRMTPTAILSWQARASEDPRFIGEAFKELASRVQAKGISTERFATLAEFVLRRQADLSSPWVAHMGDVIEFGRAAGLVGDEMWRRYVGVLGTPIVPATALRVAHQGNDRLQLHYDFSGYRLGSGNLSLYSTTVALKYDGHVEDASTGPIFGVSPVGYGNSTKLNLELLRREAFPREVTIEWDMVVTPTSLPGATAPSVRRREVIPVRDFTPTPRIGLVTEEDTREAVRSCVIKSGSSANHVIVQVTPAAVDQPIVVQVAIEWYATDTGERRVLAGGHLHLGTGATVPASFVINAPGLDVSDARTRVIFRPALAYAQSLNAGTSPTKNVKTPQHNVIIEPER